MKKITYLFIAVSIVFVSCTKEEGCTDSVAANYNSDAENDDGSCIFDIVGVIDNPKEAMNVAINGFKNHKK